MMDYLKKKKKSRALYIIKINFGSDGHESRQAKTEFGKNWRDWKNLSQFPATVYVHLIFEEAIKYGGGTGML